MITFLPIGIVAFILYCLGLRAPMRQVVYRLAQAWAISIIHVAGVKAEVSGRENIIRKGGVCFISNHCGYFDIILLLAYANRPFGFVAKKELTLVPALNCWIFMLGGLFIDRKNIRKAIKTINNGVQRIKNGSGMVIFPEGTRSKGHELLPFHPGSFKLATASAAPVVPVAIVGSYDIFEKNARLTKAPVKLAFLEVIETANLSAEERKKNLPDKVFQVIKEQLDKFNSSNC